MEGELMRPDFEIIVNDEARAREFQDIMGSNILPVKSPQPSMGTLPGMKGKKFYLLDVAKLTPYHCIKLARHLAETFGLEPDQVHDDMTKNGVPVLAEDCTVVINNPMKWL